MKRSKWFRAMKDRSADEISWLSWIPDLRGWFLARSQAIARFYAHRRKVAHQHKEAARHRHH